MNDATAKTRRLVKRLLWGFGILAGAVVLAWLAFHYAGTRSLAGALEELRAEGYATSLAELAPPALPAEKNGAAEFLAAFERHPDPEREDEALNKAAEEGFAALSDGEKAAVRELLDKAEGLCRKIREGRMKGGARFTRDYAKGLAMELPELAGATGAASLLLVRAQTQTPAEARDTVRDLFALADAYREDPQLVCQLVRFVILGFGAEAVDKAVSADTPEAELRAWLDVLPAPVILDGAIERAFRGELAAGAQVAGRPLNDVLRDLETPSPGITGSWIVSPGWNLASARYLRAMRRLIETSRKPYLQARLELQSFTDEMRAGSFLDALSMLLVPATSRALDSDRITRTQLALLRAGIAAEIARATAGRYPETCDALDPLTERPFVLEKGKLSSAGLPDRPEVVEDYKLYWKLRRP